MKIKFEDCTDYDIGVKYLEQEFGEDWFNRIDLDFLNMKHIDNCIIGQLSENGYKDYVEKLGLSFREYCDNGSNVFSSYYKEYSLLMHRHNWENIIQGKRVDIHKASETVLLVNDVPAGRVSNLQFHPQKYLLTFESGSCMILTSLKDVPKSSEGQKFTYEII